MAWLIVFIVDIAATLFLPTGPLLEGDQRIGTIRIWWWYRLLTRSTLFWPALTVVVVHLCFTAVTTWFFVRLGFRILRRRRIPT